MVLLLLEKSTSDITLVQEQSLLKAKIHQKNDGLVSIPKNFTICFRPIDRTVWINDVIQ